MAKTNYQSIDEYHQTFPEHVQERMQSIRELVHEIAPEVQEVISYQIPAFKIGKKFLIYYAGFAKHLTISNPWSEAFLAAFATELKNLKVSKSAIQLPLDQPFPLDFVRRILEFRSEEVGATK